MSPVSLIITEAEYHADPGKVIAYAAESGPVAVVRDDGTTRFMISIPPAEQER